MPVLAGFVGVLAIFLFIIFFGSIPEDTPGWVIWVLFLGGFSTCMSSAYAARFYRRWDVEERKREDVEAFAQQFLEKGYIQGRVDRALEEEANICQRWRNKVVDLQQNGVKNRLVNFDETYEEAKNQLNRSQDRFIQVYNRFACLKKSIGYSLRDKKWQAYVPLNDDQPKSAEEIPHQS